MKAKDNCNSVLNPNVQYSWSKRTSSLSEFCQRLFSKKILSMWTIITPSPQFCPLSFAFFKDSILQNGLMGLPILWKQKIITHSNNNSPMSWWLQNTTFECASISQMLKGIGQGAAILKKKFNWLYLKVHPGDSLHNYFV